MQSPKPPRPIYRWVDEAGALSYLRFNAMIGRVRHYLIKGMAGQFHSKFMTGLSFSRDPAAWRCNHICFVIDQNELDNASADINGQAVYEFSDAMSLWKEHSSPPDKDHIDFLRKCAIALSAEEPDEVFIVGSIRSLTPKIKAIHAIHPPIKALDALRRFSDQNDIPLSLDPPKFSPVSRNQVATTAHAKKLVCKSQSADNPI